MPVLGGELRLVRERRVATADLHDQFVGLRAECAVTQPVFDAAQLGSFVRRIEDSHIRVAAGIWPLVSVRNAESIASEVPVVTVAPSVIDRMRRANEESKEHAVAEGIAIAREIQVLRSGVCAW